MRKSMHMPKTAFFTGVILLALAVLLCGEPATDDKPEDSAAPEEVSHGAKKQMAADIREYSHLRFEAKTGEENEHRDALAASFEAEDRRLLAAEVAASMIDDDDIYVLITFRDDLIVRIGAPMVPHLRANLASEDTGVVSRSISALGLLKAKEALPEIIAAAGADYWTVRRGAASALGKIGDESALDTLLQLLKDDDVQVRLEACYAIAPILPLRMAVKLFEKLVDESATVRYAAARAIADPELDPAFRRILIRQNASGGPQFWYMVLETVGYSSCYTYGSYILARFFADGQPVVRIGAVKQLLRLLGKSQREEVAKRFEESPEDVRKFFEKVKNDLDLLIRIDDDEYVRSFAASVLEELAPLFEEYLKP